MSDSRPVTAATAVDILGMLNMTPIDKATIRKWAERGKVRKYGLDQYGIQKYELRDIMICASGSRLAAVS